MKKELRLEFFLFKKKLYLTNKNNGLKTFFFQSLKNHTFNDQNKSLFNIKITWQILEIKRIDLLIDPLTLDNWLRIKQNKHGI